MEAFTWVVESDECMDLGAFSSRLGLSPEIWRTMTFEVAGEDWLNDGAEDDLSTACLRQGHPEHEDELEGVVEGYVEADERMNR